MEICALFNKFNCLRKWTDSGLAAIASSNASAILCRISAAEALVNVTTSSSSTSIGLFSSSTFSIIRVINTFVFPEPAAAETRISFPVAQIAFHWASVNVSPSGFTGMCIIPHLLTHFIERQFWVHFGIRPMLC